MSNIAERCEDNSPRWDIAHHQRACSDTSTVTDPHRPEYRRTGPDENSVADLGMTPGIACPTPTEGHSVEQQDVVADSCGLTDHDTHAVVDDHTTTDQSCGMYLHPGTSSGPVGQQPSR
jgi:hypothetical protein